MMADATVIRVTIPCEQQQKTIRIMHSVFYVIYSLISYYN